MNERGTHGEPWYIAPGAPGIAWADDGDRAATFDDVCGPDGKFSYAERVAIRAVACVNALRGIPDPEAFVRAVNYAMTQNCGCSSNEPGRDRGEPNEWHGDGCWKGAIRAARGSK